MKVKFKELIKLPKIKEFQLKSNNEKNSVSQHNVLKKKSNLLKKLHLLKKKQLNKMNKPSIGNNLAGYFEASLDYNKANKLSKDELRVFRMMQVRKNLKEDKKREVEFQKIKLSILSVYLDYYTEMTESHQELNEEIIQEISKERAIEDYRIWLNDNEIKQLEISLEKQILGLR